jgi:hypothetical protein
MKILVQKVRRHFQPFKKKLKSKRYLMHYDKQPTAAHQLANTTWATQALW